MIPKGKRIGISLQRALSMKISLRTRVESAAVGNLHY